MILATIQAILYLTFLWAGWHALKRMLLPTALDNIPGPAGGAWLTGHLTSLFSADAWDFHREIAEQFGSIVRIRGPFRTNQLYVFDPKAVHHLLVKDQNIYDETKLFVNLNRVMLGEGIFTSMGDVHRRQRKMLTPVFTISHMREMGLIFYEVVHKVQRAFDQNVKDGPVEIDVMHWMTRLALELIGQSGLGYSFDELTENAVPHRYGEVSKSLSPKHMKYFAHIIPFTSLICYLTNMGSSEFRRYIVDRISFGEVKESKNIIDVMHETSVEIYESKKKAIEQGDEILSAQIGRGKDIMSILLRANMQADENDKLSEKELLGQITSLTFAATDTTSGALCRIFHLLSLHKDVQSRVREELRQAREVNDGKDLDYDTLVSLPFLDAVCRETLRLHPPVSTLQRQAYQDAALPFSNPIKDINGEYISEISIPKGTVFHISILNSNRNPELWGPDAHEWKPERWLNPLPQSLIDAHVPGIYSHSLTFFAGGRSCLGFKFSQLEMKVAMAVILEKFEFSPTGNDIFWQMSNIATPNLNATSTHPVLPLTVSMAP